MKHPLSEIAALLVAPLAVFHADASVRQSNVLFIAMDGLNDKVGCLGGHSQTKTPNIDRLAKSPTASLPPRKPSFNERGPVPCGKSDPRTRPVSAVSPLATEPRGS